MTAKCPKGCAKKSFEKKGASGQVSLAALIKKPLKVKTVITVVVSKPGSGSAVKILKIRSAQVAATHVAVPARGRCEAGRLLGRPPGTTAAQHLSCAAEPL